jgi:hypothetical protein
LATIVNEDTAEKSEPAWLIQLRAALEGMPSDYATSYKQISQMRQQFLKEISAALQPRLNTHFQQQPQESLVEKRQIATTINGDLRLLNLCVRCPVTQSPSILIADSGDVDRNNRFRFQSFDSAGRRHRTGVSVRIPKLELEEAPHREESLAMHGGFLQKPGPPSK